MTVFDGCFGASLRLQAEGVGIGSGQLVLFRKPFGGFELAGKFPLLKVTATNGFAHFFVGWNGIATNWHASHVFNATRHDDICGTRADDVMSQGGGLLGRTTLGVNRDAGCFDRTTVSQPCCARDVHALGR